MTGHTTNLQGMVEALRAAKKVAVVSHVNPDGDAIGSILAVARLLEEMGKDHVTCVCEDDVPRVYQWLPNVDALQHPDSVEPDFDTLVIVDVASFERIGKLREKLPKPLGPGGPRILVIDHHLVEKPCGDVNFVDPTYSSTGEIIAELFDVAGIALSQQAAICIFVALVTDTGGFRFSNTNARSHRIAARLLETGIDVAHITERVFDVMSEGKVELLRRALDRMEMDRDTGFAYTIIRASDLEEANAKPEDIDGLVNFTRNIRGMRVGMLLREVEPGKTKISLRARNEFNAAQFLKAFGGGGHAAAAGATVNEPLDELKPRVVDALRKALRDES